MAAKHFNIHVHGRVQAVFFRFSAKKMAENLGVTGFARNEQDGSVSIEAEGSEEALERFVAWCKEGPLLAKVTHIEVKEGHVKGEKEFSTY